MTGIAQGASWLRFNLRFNLIPKGKSTMKRLILLLALTLFSAQPLTADESVVSDGKERLSAKRTNTVAGNAPLSLAEQLASSEYGSFSDVSTYLGRIQAMVKKNPVLLLGELHYPFSLYDAGNVKATFKSEKEAKANKKRLITKKVLASLRAQKAENLFVNYQGIMIGDGEIWINRTEKGEYFIKAMNP